ncbi:hypothetical protein [Pyrobaculum neutrophilum]|uniref:Uncharacterized protein n=1 Tax=Pyrobaculum neutrophilum (strain DSM 2338 / JCM 9278 / NBRC 100436 / V24Sta) TaxID=444157 RepID=B1YBS7_PYRNV|nr:hypothetical protein [Pyrobaculum neutrophilum]ACB39311.1 conserved hypothetical protein [Pyrobaculum neutrophilum V24Sta]
MRSANRRLIRVRGSYVVYLPKEYISRFGVEEVVVYWEGPFLGVKPAGVERTARFTWRGGVEKVVVGAYASGFDAVVLAEAPPGALDALRPALEVVEGRAAETGGEVRVDFFDSLVDKGAVAEMMLRAVRYMADALAAGAASPRGISALDQEVDRHRLRMSRLCVRWPTPTCPFYIQLARYFERAADHLAALAAEEADRRLFKLLAEAAEGLERARGDLEGALEYLRRLGGMRHMALEAARGERETLHAVRVLDYLENSAEVYIDMALYSAHQCRGCDER